MRNTFIVLVFLNFFYLKGLLKAPVLVDDVQLQQHILEWHTRFTWLFDWKFPLGLHVKGDYSCFYENSTSSFSLSINSIPFYSCNRKNSKAASSDNESNYYYEKPIAYIDQDPKILSVDQLSSFIDANNVIFYTGAGISAAVVPAMKELESLCCLDKGKLYLLKTILMHPVKINNGFEKFCRRCIHAPATDAHKALHVLAQKKKCAIVTENADLLHERTGSLPVHFDGSKVTIDQSELKCIDAIVCIGLSHDDRGLLGYYKKHNSEGIIIAIDMKQPSYLSDTDFLVQGDIQSIVPTLDRLSH